MERKKKNTTAVKRRKKKNDRRTDKRDKQHNTNKTDNTRQTARDGLTQDKQHNTYTHVDRHACLVVTCHLSRARAVTKKCPSTAHSDADCNRSAASSNPSRQEDMAFSMPGSGRGSSAMDLRWPSGGGWFTRKDANEGSWGEEKIILTGEGGERDAGGAGGKEGE